MTRNRNINLHSESREGTFTQKQAMLEDWEVEMNCAGKEQLNGEKEQHFHGDVSH